MQLPWMRDEEWPGPGCFCGKTGCMEKWVSGTGFARDYKEVTGETLTSREIMEAFDLGEEKAAAAVERYEDRLARGLAQVINVLDPDIFVFGGGMSKVKRLYQDLPAKVEKYVFGREAETPMVPARYGDSSGVRGAAWLWPSLGVAGAARVGWK
jgi:fructokinase